MKNLLYRCAVSRTRASSRIKRSKNTLWWANKRSTLLRKSLFTWYYEWETHRPPVLSDPAVQTEKGRMRSKIPVSQRVAHMLGSVASAKHS